MKRLQKKLLKNRQAFNRRLRRLLIICFAALGVGLFATMSSLRRAERREGAGRSRIVKDPMEQRRFAALPGTDADDPSRLIAQELIAPEADYYTHVDRDNLAYIIKTVMSIPQDELLKRVDRSITWDDFNDERRLQNIMGRVCSFRGTLRRLEKNDTVQFPDLGIDLLYEGQIQDGMDRWYSFYIVEAPEPAIERFDAADIAGVFYKLIAYQTRGGEKLITPLIVGRTLNAERERYASRGALQRFARQAPSLIFYPVLIGLPVLLCLFINIAMNRNYSKTSVARREARSARRNRH